MCENRRIWLLLYKDTDFLHLACCQSIIMRLNTREKESVEMGFVLRVLVQLIAFCRWAPIYGREK